MKRAFTLSEVLIAMAIFLIGFIAIASLFPAAAYLQKQTIDEINLDYVKGNAQAMVSVWTPDPQNNPLSAIPQDGFMHPVDMFTRQDRTYPSVATIENRHQVEWFTYALWNMRLEQWEIHILFEMDGDAPEQIAISRTSPTAFTTTATDMQPGERLVDEFGNSYKVINVGAQIEVDSFILAGPVMPMRTVIVDGSGNPVNPPPPLPTNYDRDVYRVDEYSLVILD